MHWTSLALPEQESHSGDGKLNRGDQATEHADIDYAACVREGVFGVILKNCVTYISCYSRKC